MKYYNLDNQYLNKLNNASKELAEEAFYQIIPSANNTLNSIQLFHQRLNYRIAFQQILSSSNETINELKDSIYIHDLYGKINKNNESIFVDNQYVKSLSSEPKIKLLNFVADAYEELFKKHKNLVDKKIISNNSKFVNIVPKIGWISANDQHSNYINNYFNKFYKYINYNELDKNILDFKSFIKIFINYYNLEQSNTLINKSQFIRSNCCNYFCSGLVFEFANEPYDDDLKKYNNYLKDPNLIAFNSLVKEYGFVMDLNYPWRLIFDIESSTAKKYLNKYNINNSKECFDKYYYFAEYFDYETLIKNLLNLYNFIVSQKSQIKNTNFNYINNNICISEKTINRTPIEKYEYLNQYISKKELIELFFYTKCVENNIISNEQEFEQYLSELNVIEKHKNNITMFDYISNICKTKYNKGNNKFRRNF